MKTGIFLGVAALAAATLAPTAASAQRWGPGWHEWRGHGWHRPGWGGPGWYGQPGPRYGLYHWNGGWYRHCGWRYAGYGRQVWRCY